MRTVKALKSSQTSLSEEKPYTWHLLVVTYGNNCYITGLFYALCLIASFIYYPPLTDSFLKIM